jgi:hypothetical protein
VVKGERLHPMPAADPRARAERRSADERAFVGRKNDVERIRDWVRGHGWVGKVAAISIEGPGGVGKSTLCEHALEPEEVAARGYLRADIAGQEDPADTSVFSWVERLVGSASARLDDPGAAFARTRRVLAYHHEILSALESELRSAHAGEEQMGAARAFFGAARLGVGTLRRDLKALASNQAREDVERIWKTIRSAAALQSRRWDQLTRPLKNDVRRTPMRALARSLVLDIEQLFDVGFGRESPAHNRLLIVLDDYEGLSTVLGRILVSELVPRLRDATFETLLVVIGRDDIRMTDGAWEGSLAPVLGGRRVVLRPLRADDVTQLCAARSVDDPATVTRILEESHGYPWLVDILLDDLGTTGKSPVTSYHRFVRRMARFMTEEERRWFEALCFLDAVSYATIATVLPDTDRELVMSWFIDEQSIRSFDADTWKVWPYIRHRVLLYRWSIDPEGCEVLADATGMRWRPGRSASLL